MIAPFHSLLVDEMPLALYKIDARKQLELHIRTASKPNSSALNSLDAFVERAHLPWHIAEAMDRICERDQSLRLSTRK